jgi:hypothetical protein
LIDALGPNFPVERLDKAIVGGLARPRKVERDAIHVGPEIEIAGDEFRAVVDADRPRATVVATNPGQCRRHIRAGVTVANVDRRRHLRIGVNDRQHTDLATIEQLVGKEIHRPDLVGSRRRTTVFAQFCGNLALWPFVPDLQANLDIEPIDTLRVDAPPLASQEHVYSPIAIPDPRRRDLLNALLKTGLRRSASPIEIARLPKPQNGASSPNRDLVDALQGVYQAACLRRPYGFFDSTS